MGLFWLLTQGKRAPQTSSPHVPQHLVRHNNEHGPADRAKEGRMRMFFVTLFDIEP